MWMAMDWTTQTISSCRPTWMTYNISGGGGEKIINKHKF